MISAADPVNLTGIITQDRRIVASHKSALILHRGQCVAAKESGRIEFFASFPADTEYAMRRALQAGTRQRNKQAEPTVVAVGGRVLRQAKREPARYLFRR